MKHLRTALGPLTLASFALTALLTACGGSGVAGSESSSVGNGSGGGGGGKGSGGRDSGSDTSGSETDAVVSVASVATTTGSGNTSCTTADDADGDQDGVTKAQGDCNDCDANVNPNAIEVAITEPDPETGEVPEPADEDCDGMVDNVPPASCDDGIALASGNPLDGAHAIDLCKNAPETGGWGIVSANWVKADGTVLATPATKAGILESFGSNVPPRLGARVLGLSSGRARLPGQDGACNSADCRDGGAGNPPNDFFPAEVPGCDGGPGTNIFDDIGLELVLRAPSNATGYSFDFKFSTFEYTEWVCTAYNDQFVALVTPEPPGSQHGNISFDSNNNPVSVNIGFFDVCSSCAAYAAWCEGGGCPSAPNPCCPAGPAELTGTGFDTWTSDNKILPNFSPAPVKSGGTTWLRTQAPVQPGSQVTIRFAIWDSGDQNLDSTAIIDNFRWIANGGTTVEIGTDEVPDGPPQ